MKKILVLMAHPSPSQSRSNWKMAEMVKGISGVTFVDLYALYPRFKINVEVEQQRLLEHDVIVFQFPLYWYSMPALLKEWQDVVLERGFAYGHGGDSLAAKLFLVATTAGAAAQAYTPDGTNQFPIRTLLTPLEQTANLCHMSFLPPLIQFSSLLASQDERLEQHIELYRQVLESLRDEQLDMPQLMTQEFVNQPSLPLLASSNPGEDQFHG